MHNKVSPIVQSHFWHNLSGVSDRAQGLDYSETFLNGHPSCADTSLLRTIF
jgi:hypothetical protein